MVNTTLRALDTKDSYTYLEEMYDDSLVYTQSGPDSRKMYKQSYKIESGKVELVGEPIEVHKKVEYVVNSGLTRTKFSTNNKKEDKMPKNECPECLKKINTVIANKASGFDETDREWLETLSETALDKAITPKVIEKEKVVEKTVEVNKLSPEDQAALAFGKRQLKDRREKMVKVIQGNAGNTRWTDEKLNAMSEELLEDLFESLKTKDDDVTDYSLNGNAPVIQKNDSGSGGLLLPPNVVIEETK